MQKQQILKYHVYFPSRESLQAIAYNGSVWTPENARRAVKCAEIRRHILIKYSPFHYLQDRLDSFGREQNTPGIDSALYCVVSQISFCTGDSGNADTWR